MKKLLIDMDGVLVDFGKKVNEIDLDDTISMYFKKSPDEIEGVFRDLEPLKNAVKSVIKLHESGKYDLFIATTAPWNNPSSFSDKRIWIEEHFGEIFKKLDLSPSSTWYPSVSKASINDEEVNLRW